MAVTISISGVELEIEERGDGRPLLFLHAGEGLGPNRPWLDLLARKHRVIAPVHPGFGSAKLPDWIGSVDDLAYLYLDLADEMRLENAVLAGVSFGGWVAAEMMVRSSARFSCVALATPLGIKVSDRETRDIADFHAMSRANYLASAWADPAKGEFDTEAMSDTELRSFVSGREALCLYGWRPYMHNPRLKPWLHRIDRPTLLLWGDADRILTPAYRSGWSQALPRARTVTIPGAGHYPHWEQPDEFVRHVAEFVEES
jgi:pimeloyl-ACP methyl ester carboxylesterase